MTSLRGLFSFIEDWWQDDESSLVPFNPLMENRPPDLGKVHRGFQTAMHKLWPQIKVALDAPEIDLVGKKGIQITGHSKGAALTFLAAMMVRLQYPGVEHVYVNAFAAPQAGDADFARAYKTNKLESNTTRHQHANDIVPFLPPYTDCLSTKMNWNVFDHLEWKWSFDSIALHCLLKAVGDQIAIGYARVGSVRYYVTGCNVQTGMTAELAARAAITEKIKDGDGDEIADAHSATGSYWPALFAICPPE